MAFQVPADPRERLRLVIDASWEILMTQIVSGRLTINKEASLQLHLASIIRELGEVMCVLPRETFSIELESSISGMEVDITCAIGGEKAAIELKCFRKLSNRAKDVDMYEVLYDIKRLQSLSAFSVRKFLCLADHNYYAHGIHKGHAESVSIKDGKVYPANTPIHPSWLGKWKCYANHDVITFKQDVAITWVTRENWYFLSLDV